MDNIIAKYKFKKDGILNYCYGEGVAYQRDMSKSVPYDKAYFDKYILYEKTPIGRDLNRARVNAVSAWASRLKIIDIGIGCGTFIKYALNAKLDIFGYDINHVAINWLNKREIFKNPYADNKKIMCYTFWDSLEHIPDPQMLLEKIQIGSYVFISIPIFESLEDIKDSKHYRPDEHYYYFTTLGFISWMMKYNFALKKIYNFETECGRSGIKTFMFEKLPVVKKIDSDLLKKFFADQVNTTDEIIKFFSLAR